ncbi:MAG: hypothetical protein ACPHTD_14140, partial [Gammaproteobacteria bacterium]
EVIEMVPGESWQISYTRTQAPLSHLLTEGDDTVQIGDRVETNGAFSQTVSYDPSRESFEVRWGTKRGTISTVDAANELLAFLKAQDAEITEVQVSELAAGELSISYQDTLGALTGVSIPQSETKAAATTAAVQEKGAALGAAIAEALGQLGALDTVEVTGTGSAADPWRVVYRTAAFSGISADATGEPEGLRAIAADMQVRAPPELLHTTYLQSLSLADFFALSLGSEDTEVGVSIDRAAINDAADANTRLTAISSDLSASSTDGDLARALIDNAGERDTYESLKNDRDILRHYDHVKNIDLEYTDSVFDIRFNLEKAFAGDYDLNFDLEDLPGLGEFLTQGDVIALELETDGKVHVDADFDLDLNFTLDLSSLGDPSMLIYDDSQITFNRFIVETLEPVNARGALLVGGVKVLELGITGATATADLTGSISLTDGGEDQAHPISALIDDASLWNVDLIGDIEADLPLYFPTATYPMGGTETDRNEDGIPDNVLHVDGQFRGANDYDLNFVAPDLFSFQDLFAALKDPKVLLKGLTGFFDGINDIAEGLSEADVPLIGSAPFEDLQEKIRDIERFVMGVRIDAPFVVKEARINDVTYADGALGGWLQQKIEDGVDDIFEEVLEEIRKALYEGLKDFDSDLFRFVVPVFDTDGQPQFDAAGNILTKVPKDAKDVQLVLNGSTLTFNVMFEGILVGEKLTAARTLEEDRYLADGTLLAAGTTVPEGTILPGLLPIDFNAGIPGFNLEVDADLNAQISYLMGIGLGVSPQDFVFLDTSGINAAGEEISVTVDASLTPGSTAKGVLGFLTVDLEDVNPGGSGIHGHLGF